MTGSALTLLVCGAPLASRARDVRSALASAGWSVSLVASAAGSAWTGPVDDEGRPRPAVVVVCPLTFNTANKIVAGVMDTAVTGALCDGLGAGLPIVAVPMVNTRLWGHPTWASTLTALQGWGVTLLDPSDGRVAMPRAVASGTGDAVAAAFDPQWIVAATGPAPWCG